MTRVGLIGPPGREEIERLAIRLEERGAEAVILDPGRDPEIRIGPGEISACGEDLRSLRACYVADLGVPSPLVIASDGGVDTEASSRALERSRRRLAAWETLLRHLEGRTLVVNPPATHTLHALKPFEIAACAAGDLPVPLTIATTDPAALADLPIEPRGGWITKGMSGGYTHTEAFARPGSAGEAVGLLDGAALMVQERIDGDNVRAFVLGGDCLGAAEVIPLKGSETDSRRGETRVRRIDLPVEAAKLAVAAAGLWGMIFAAVDFMRDSVTGRYVLLECNSAPFFVGFEARTGIDVSGRLASHLAGRRG